MLLAPAAMADWTVAKIDKILLYDSGNLVYVYPHGGVTNPPACDTVNGQYLSFSMSRSMAREYLSALIAAQSEGATVQLRGKGDCIDQGRSETLWYFEINSN
jgi:hypothetical protein